MGDRNTKYFHKMADIRSRRNHVVALKDESGNLVTDPSAIEDMFLAHFHWLFKCDQGQERDASGGFEFPLESEQPDGGMPNFLNSIKVRLTNQQRSF